MSRNDFNPNLKKGIKSKKRKKGDSSRKVKNWKYIDNE
jgi:hypothetical protein